MLYIVFDVLKCFFMFIRECLYFEIIVRRFFVMFYLIYLERKFVLMFNCLRWVFSFDLISLFEFFCLIRFVKFFVIV